MRILFASAVVLLATSSACRFQTVKAYDDPDAQTSTRDEASTDAALVGDLSQRDGSGTIDALTLDVPTDRGAAVTMDGSTTSLSDADPTYLPDAFLTCRWGAEPADPLPLTNGAPTSLVGLFGAGDGAWML